MNIGLKILFSRLESLQQKWIFYIKKKESWVENLNGIFPRKNTKVSSVCRLHPKKIRKQNIFYYVFYKWTRKKIYTRVDTSVKKKESTNKFGGRKSHKIYNWMHQKRTFIKIWKKNVINFLGKEKNTHHFPPYWELMPDSLLSDKRRNGYTVCVCVWENWMISQLIDCIACHIIESNNILGCYCCRENNNFVARESHLNYFTSSSFIIIVITLPHKYYTCSSSSSWITEESFFHSEALWTLLHFFYICTSFLLSSCLLIYIVVNIYMYTSRELK